MITPYLLFEGQKLTCASGARFSHLAGAGMEKQDACAKDIAKLP